jgi:hypothetical protein
VFAAVIVAEVSVGALGSVASARPEGREAAAPEMPMPSDIDSMVAAILERPLFASSRAPYEEAVIAEEDSDEDESTQTLHARLTGVAILPEGREALFERDGSKPVAVKEGRQIDGWTVKTIHADKVVLSNASGEEVLEPTNAEKTVKRPRMAANGATAQTQKGAPTMRAPQAASGGKQGHK